MVDNFVFEIDNFGAVRNTNRAYYLTRSQPRFLSSMGRAVHEAQKAAGQNDRGSIEAAYDYVKRDHEIWTQAAHLAGSAGLSRCYDFGEGPPEEALKRRLPASRRLFSFASYPRPHTKMEKQ